MYHTHKSATCCYCGSKAVLTLGGKMRHELKCSACGAPISQMKALRSDHPVDRFVVDRGVRRDQRKSAKAGKAGKKKKKRASLGHRLFDMAEDIFDIFD